MLVHELLSFMIERMYTLSAYRTSYVLLIVNHFDMLAIRLLNGYWHVYRIAFQR